MFNSDFLNAMVERVEEKFKNMTIEDIKQACQDDDSEDFNKNH